MWVVNLEYSEPPELFLSLSSSDGGCGGGSKHLLSAQYARYCQIFSYLKDSRISVWHVRSCFIVTVTH